MRQVRFSLTTLMICIGVVAVVLVCVIQMRRYISDMSTVQAVIAGQLRDTNDVTSLPANKVSRVAKLLVKKLEEALRPEKRENAHNFLRKASYVISRSQKRELFQNLEQSVAQGRTKADSLVGITLGHFVDPEKFNATQQEAVVQLLSKCPVSRDTVSMQLQLGGLQHHQALLDLVAANPGTAIAKDVLNEFSAYTWPPVAELSIELHATGMMSVEELAEQASIKATNEGRELLQGIASSPQQSRQDRATAIESLAEDVRGRECLADLLRNVRAALPSEGNVSTESDWFISTANSAMAMNAASSTLLEDLKAASASTYWHQSNNGRTFNKSITAKLKEDATRRAKLCQGLLSKLQEWHESELPDVGDTQLRETDLRFLLANALSDPEILEMSLVRRRIQLPETGYIPDSCLEYYVDAVGQTLQPDFQILAADALLAHKHEDKAVHGLIRLISDTSGNINVRQKMLASNLLRKRFGRNFWLDGNAWKNATFAPYTKRPPIKSTTNRPLLDQPPKKIYLRFSESALGFD